LIILAQKFKGLALFEQKYRHVEVSADPGPLKRKYPLFESIIKSRPDLKEEEDDDGIMEPAVTLSV
jgi:hypothetical protein